MGYMQHLLAALLVLLVSSCQPAFAQIQLEELEAYTWQAGMFERCEAVPFSKIQEGMQIAKVHPQIQLLTGRAATRFMLDKGIPGNVIAVALVETGGSHMIVTAAKRGNEYIICYSGAIDPATVQMFRRHAEAAT